MYDGTIPIAAAFSEKGVSDDSLAAFMMSSIILNPQLLIYSSALGKTTFNFSNFKEPTNRDTDPNLAIF